MIRTPPLSSKVVLTRHRLKKGGGTHKLTPKIDAIDHIGHPKMRTQPRGDKFPGAAIKLPPQVVTNHKNSKEKEVTPSNEIKNDKQPALTNQRQTTPTIEKKRNKTASTGEQTL